LIVALLRQLGLGEVRGRKYFSSSDKIVALLRVDTFKNDPI
jgi:hypothetical protein